MFASANCSLGFRISLPGVKSLRCKKAGQTSRAPGHTQHCRKVGFIPQKVLRLGQEYFNVIIYIEFRFCTVKEKDASYLCNIQEA